MPASLRLLSVVAILAAVPALAAAQARPATDSLPVRAGSWAAEGGVGGVGGGANVGLLRFLSPQSALTAQFAGNWSRAEASGSGSAAVFTGSFTSLTGSLGWRRYGTVRRALAPFGGLGALVSYDRVSGSQPRRAPSLGAYGELGAAYHVLDRLALNASTGAQVLRGQARYDSPVGTRVTTTDWRTSFGGVRLSATLFF